MASFTLSCRALCLSERISWTLMSSGRLKRLPEPKLCVLIETLSELVHDSASVRAAVHWT